MIPPKDRIERDEIGSIVNQSNINFKIFKVDPIQTVLIRRRAYLDRFLRILRGEIYQAISNATDTLNMFPLEIKKKSLKAQTPI